MKSKKISKFKIGMFSGLLAVVLLLVGFWIVAPKATRASAAVGDIVNLTTNFEGVTVQYKVKQETPTFICEWELVSIPVGYELLSVSNVSKYAYQLREGTFALMTPAAPHNDGYNVKNDIIVNLSKRIALPADPTKEGYVFNGWYFDVACTQPYDGSPILNNFNLYAGWTINTYTVSFNTNGGNVVDDQIINWNTVVIAPTPTKVGHIFKGWLLNGVLYENQPIKGNANFVASWEAITYTVTFYADNEVYTTLDIPYGSILGDVLANANIKNVSAFTLNGERISLTSTVTGKAAFEIKALTTNERVGAFIGDNVWLLWSALIAIAGLTITLVIVIKKR